MFEGRSVAVVVPARDEAAFLAETVRSVPAFVEHVVIVDDASRDATSAIAVLAAESDKRIVVVRHASQRGVGGALATGYREARALGADVVAVMAGDGQMHPDDLEIVVAPVARGLADYVKGNRVRHPSARRVMPLGRLVGTTVFAFFTARAAGISGIGDSQCGYTAIGARALDSLQLDAMWSGYGYPNDLLGALALGRMRVAEVVVRPVYRGEASGLRLRHLGVIAFLITRVAFRRMRAALGQLVARFVGAAPARAE